MEPPAEPDAPRLRLRRIIADPARAAAEGVLDLRELPAPEPLHQSLLRISRLQAGDDCILWTPRVPRMLLPKLQERGLWHVVEACPDGSALLYVKRP